MKRKEQKNKEKWTCWTFSSLPWKQNKYRIEIINQKHKHYLKILLKKWISKHLRTFTPLKVLGRLGGERKNRKLFIVKSQGALAGPLVFPYWLWLHRFKSLIPQDLHNNFRGHHCQVQRGRRIHKAHSLHKNSQAYIFASQSCNTFRGPDFVCLATILFFVCFILLLSFLARL